MKILQGNIRQPTTRQYNVYRVQFMIKTLSKFNISNFFRITIQHLRKSGETNLKIWELLVIMDMTISEKPIFSLMSIIDSSRDVFFLISPKHPGSVTSLWYATFSPLTPISPIQTRIILQLDKPCPVLFDVVGHICQTNLLNHHHLSESTVVRFARKKLS